MDAKIRLGAIAADVVLKDIKNVHLSVHPPTGRVRIAAPARMSLDTIRVFAISKLDWIKRQQKKLCDQERESPREYLDRESHFVWGKRYLLTVVEGEQPASILLKHNKMLLTVRTHTNESTRMAIVDRWYREQVRAAAAELVAKWEPLIEVRVRSLHVRKMRTRWGSCNTQMRRILLNTDLAKKPCDCLEYIVVHEMVHLLEPTHNARFVSLMDHFMPRWQFHRQVLNRLPVRHEDWEY